MGTPEESLKAATSVHNSMEHLNMTPLTGTQASPLPVLLLAFFLDSSLSLPLQDSVMYLSTKERDFEGEIDIKYLPFDTGQPILTGLLQFPNSPRSKQSPQSISQQVPYAKIHAKNSQSVKSPFLKTKSDSAVEDPINDLKLSTTEEKDLEDIYNEWIRSNVG